MPELARMPTETAHTVVELVLAQTRAALLMINSDQEARRLAAAASAMPEVDGTLGQWLYRAWWSGVDQERPPAIPSTTASTAAPAAPALEAARRTVARSSSGWLVLAATGDIIVAGHVRSGERKTARADAVLSSSRPGMPPRPGDLVSLITGNASLESSQGWWRATTGDRTPRPGTKFDRWYVHAADFDAALILVPLLMEQFIRLRCDASLKCPPNDALFGRRDALVVYLPRARSAQAEGFLPEIADRLTVLLRPDIPPFTRQLLPGLATAQDPGWSISYGQLRCAQLAAVAAETEPNCSDDQLAARLTHVGIDPCQPELVAP